MTPLFDVRAGRPVREQAFRRCGAGPVPSRAELAAAEAVAAAAARDDEQRCAVDAAVAAALVESDAAWQARLTAAIDTERTAVQHACAGFALARRRFFHEAEGEVLQLAVALAGKVLAREVETHATPLAAAVKAALAPCAADERTVLQVPVCEAEAWRQWALAVPQVSVEVDATLPRGECRLRGVDGLAELGVQAQLAVLQRHADQLLAERAAC